MWSPGHPTPQEQATAQQVLAAHDPDKRRREEEAEAAARRELVARLLADTVDERTWQALTAQRRDEDTRLGLRMLALLARRA